MIYRFLNRLFVFTILIVSLASCRDEFPGNGEYDIPDGYGDVKCELTCTLPMSAKIGSRAYEPIKGNVIEDVTNLCVFIFDRDGKFVRKVTNSEIVGSKEYDKKTVDQKSPEDALTGNQAAQGQDQTVRVTFTIENLRYGIYKFYAVANMGDLNEYEIETVDDLRKIQVKWNSDVISNNQMFGYFTEEGKSESKGFEAHNIIFRQSGMKIHSWIKRTVSKVTIAYNGENLYDNVFVYIHNVTIYDIPNTCYIGQDNTPTKDDQLTNRYGGELLPNTRLIYNDKGEIIDPAKDTKGDPVVEHEKWMMLTNAYAPKDKGGLGLRGAADHASDDPSLFFFENMQGEYKDVSNKDKYDKHQHKDGEDGVGTPIKTPVYDENGNIVYDENGLSVNDFKDRILYGTYIEVDGYYVSLNDGNASQGPIKYRFMLGKDTEYNYDAQRNYHYKLTLGFRGWANQPDWHIEYEEEDPGIEVGPIVRVSYLYNTKSTLPIKLSGNCTKLTLKIVENNWAPFDEATNSVPAATVTSSPSAYEFKWAKNVYDATKDNNGMSGTLRPYLGFLALQVPGNDRKEIPTILLDDYSNKSQNEGQLALKEYYENNHQDERVFYENDLKIKDDEYVFVGATNNNWRVNKVVDSEGNVDEKSKMLLVPLWTRNKSMIHNANFSGNNPSEYFVRKAVIEIEGEFTMADGSIVKRPAKCIVYQEPRIVNPKAIWREAGSNSTFRVTLMTAENSNAQSNYKELVSVGTWTAEVEYSNASFIKLVPKEQINTEKDNVIKGKAGTFVDFDVEFTATTTEDKPNYAIINVTYHADNCVHKILVRQGYKQPTLIGGNYWSSFTLYSATLESGDEEKGTDCVYKGVQTASPLAVGSFFRRGKISAGIFARNQALGEPYQAMGAPGKIVPSKNNLILAEFECALNGSTNLYWTGRPSNSGNTYKDGYLSYRDDNTKPNIDMGRYDIGTEQYVVPSLEDYVKLSYGNDFAFGVVYGEGASSTSKNFVEATCYEDPYNEGNKTINGVRAAIVYDPYTGRQVIFPLGRYGMGRRRQVNEWNNNDDSYKNGTLWYSDVQNPLRANNSSSNNWWRPMPYNLPIAAGAVYWIDKWKDGPSDEKPKTYTIEYNGKTIEYTLFEPSLGWDVNYQFLDFNQFSTVCRADALPIKLIRRP